VGEWARPLTLALTGLAIALAGAFAITNWEITQHARQACEAYHALATSKGAASPYDQTVRREFQQLYKLRCR